VEEAVVIGLQIGNRVQSRGFGFVKFEREKDVISAKEAHHVYMLGKRVEIKDAVARAYLPSEDQRTTSRKYSQEFPKVNHSLLDDELIEEHGPQKRRPLPEKCLPSWFFIFRKWLPGFLRDETERLGERYPLSSLKGDFRATCRMELDHAAIGYPKLSDFMRSLPGICRMCVVPVGSGPATHMVLLPPFSRPKYVPLLEPVSFDHDELPESVSDNHSPRSPLNTNITVDSPHNTDIQQGDACSETNVQSQQGDESSRSNAESQQDESSTGSLLDDFPVSTTMTDLVKSEPTRKPDLFVAVPTRKPDLIESGPTRKPDLFVSVPTRKPDLIESGPTRSPNPVEYVPLPQRNGCGPVQKLNLLESVPARKLESRPISCFIDCPVQRPAATPSSRETDTRFSFFQSQWDKYLVRALPEKLQCLICWLS
jgi:RNA recognition motif-containing protein